MKLVTISVVVLICFSGFRDSVGIDFFTYKMMYENLNNYYLHSIEPVWFPLAQLLHSFHFSFVGWCLVTSLVILVGFQYGFWKLSKSISLSWLFFLITILFATSMNVVRQYVAMSIVFAGTYLVLEKKWKWFCVVVMIALQFHVSAIVSLVIPLLYSVKRKKILWIGLLVSFLFGEALMNIFMEGIRSLVQGFIGLSESRRTYGYDVDSIDNGIASGLYKYTLNIIAVLLIIICEKMRDKNKEYFLYKNFLLNLFITSVIVYNMFMTFQVYRRLYEYFFMYVTLLIPYICVRHQNAQVRLITYLLFSACFVAFSLKASWGTPYEMNLTLFE